jgi:hypothetical protein
MIVDHIGGNHLEETEQGVRMPELEVAQYAAIVRTKLQVSVLDQVVDDTARRVSPSEGGSEHNRRNHRMRAVDKLFPSRGLPGFDTRPD